MRLPDSTERPTSRSSSPARPSGRGSAPEGHLAEGVYRFDNATLGFPSGLRSSTCATPRASWTRECSRSIAWRPAGRGRGSWASGEVTGSFLAPWLPEPFLEMNRGPASKASIQARIEGDAGLVLAPFLSDSVRGSGKTAGADR